MAKKKAKAPTPWDIAKPLLEKLYIDNEIDDSMPPREVVKLRKEFEAVKYDRFRDNFNEMKKRIRKHRSRGLRDNVAFTHDTTIYELAENVDDCWNGSEAQLLLMIDVKCNMHKLMKPKALWMYRQQYHT